MLGSNKCRVYKAEFKINAPGVNLGSWCLFERGILNEDFLSKLHASSLFTILY